MSDRVLIPARWVGPGDVKHPESGRTLHPGDTCDVPPGEALASDFWEPVDKRAAAKAAAAADAESETAPAPEVSTTVGTGTDGTVEAAPATGGKG